MVVSSPECQADAAVSADGQDSERPVRLLFRQLRRRLNDAQILRCCFVCVSVARGNDEVCHVVLVEAVQALGTLVSFEKRSLFLHPLARLSTLHANIRGFTFIQMTA